MAPSQPRLLPQNLQNRFLDLLTPLIKTLNRWGIHPNAFTLAGFVFTMVAAAALFEGSLRIGGLLILAGGLCDCIDGNLARAMNKASRFGALFDSTIDRYSEFVMFLGILTYFILRNESLTAIVVFAALCGSIMVSYSRARAESLGFEAQAGLMQRPERIVFLGLGALIHPVAFKLAIWVVAIFANLTALQRLGQAHQQHKTEKNKKAASRKHEIEEA
ncbi:MAG: CDP-alcohol phosphatidyltransferase family protein [Desulfobacterales bacterium]|jgi:CDP-diacylglycerol--glycerol-3-phosphate 3-phosphatidyltransferase